MPKHPERALRWLDYADTDLRSAAMLVKDADLARNAGFFAQQAAEKSLKAILASRDDAIPRTHDLGVLADWVEPVMKKLPSIERIWNGGPPLPSIRGIQSQPG